MALCDYVSGELVKELRKRGYKIIAPERREEDHVLVSTPSCQIYQSAGRFFVNYRQPELPICSYATMEGVQTSLYSRGLLPTPYASIYDL